MPKKSVNSLPASQTELQTDQLSEGSAGTIEISIEQRRSTKISCRQCILISMLIMLLLMTSALVLMQMLAKEKEPDRSVEFCMVFSNTLDSSDALLANIRNLKDQTHKDWKAAYFKNKFNFTAHVPNVRVFNSFNNEGRNIYEAITTYCSQKSYVFILHTTEDFFAKTTLANISRQISSKLPLGPFGVFVPYIKFQKLFEPDYSLRQIRRDMKPLMETVIRYAAHLRIFPRELYLLMSHRSLHDDQGNFYNSTLCFLLPLAQMSTKRDPIENHFPELEQYMYIPKEMMESQTVALITNRTFTISEYEEDEIFSRHPFGPFTEILYLTREFSDYSTMLSEHHPALIFKQSSNQQFIPSIIHQIWIGGKPPQIKQYFMTRNQQLHPDFEYKLWGEEDITMENFPHSYQLIMMLFELDKTAEFSRMSMIADFMRSEIIFRYGGFYLDTNYQILQTCLHKYQKYKLFLTEPESYFSHITLQGGLFGAPPRSPYVARLLQATALAHIHLMGNSNIESGSYFFRKAINFNDEYDPDIYFGRFDVFYPYADWLVDIRTQKNKCVISNDEIAEEEFAQLQIAVQTEQYTVLANCDQLYPNAYGIDHFNIGKSWMKSRFKNL